MAQQLAPEPDVTSAFTSYPELRGASPEMETMFELFQRVFEATPRFSRRLKALKGQNNSVQWYPFTSLDKIHVISKVAPYFDTVDARFMGARPRIIDVGTADGDISFLFESVGCDVVSIDNAPSNYNRCAGVRSMREQIDSRVTLIETDIDYDFSVEGSYDLILFLDIMYHLRNPLGALIHLSQLGHHMILTTRIFETVSGKASVHHYPYSYLLNPFEAAFNDPTNYWIFTQAALERLLDRSGWRIVKSEYFGYSGDDSSPFAPDKDKRVVALCERVEGYERLKYGHFIDRQAEAQTGSRHASLGDRRLTPDGRDPAIPALESAALEARLKDHEMDLPEMRMRLEEYRSLLSDRDATILTMNGSKSWRLTAPLRLVADVMRRSKSQIGSLISGIAKR